MLDSLLFQECVAACIVLCVRDKSYTLPLLYCSLTFVDGVCSEIQPLEVRAAACSFNVAMNMLFTFVIGQCFVTMLCSMQWGVFLFFAGQSPCLCCDTGNFCKQMSFISVFMYKLCPSVDTLLLLCQLHSNVDPEIKSGILGASC